MQLPPDLRPPAPLTVLDVGCGIRPQMIFSGSFTVGVDAHKPYLDYLRAQGFRHTLVHSKWQILKKLMDDSFDAVVALDFIEHLERRDGKSFLREAMRVAKVVVIFTPQGWLEQHGDAWKMGGEKWQEHRSAWTLEDFEGWRTAVVANGSSDAIWAVHIREE